MGKRKNKIVWVAQSNSGQQDDYANWIEGVFETPEAAMEYVDSEYETDYKLLDWQFGYDAVIDTEGFWGGTKGRYWYDQIDFHIHPVEVQS